jgi:hypothetical protein
MKDWVSFGIVSALECKLAYFALRSVDEPQVGAVKWKVANQCYISVEHRSQYGYDRSFANAIWTNEERNVLIKSSFE